MDRRGLVLLLLLLLLLMDRRGLVLLLLLMDRRGLVRTRRNLIELETMPLKKTLLLPLLPLLVAKAVAAEPDGARTGPVGNLSGP
jgi:hypothetical protein